MPCVCACVSVHARMHKDNIKCLFYHFPPFIWWWGLPLNSEHSILATMTFCSGDSLPPSPGCWESQAATTPTWFYVGSRNLGLTFVWQALYSLNHVPSALPPSAVWKGKWSKISIYFCKDTGMWHHRDSKQPFSVDLGKVFEVHELVFFLCKTKTETFTESTAQGYIWLQFRFFHYTSVTEHYVIREQLPNSANRGSILILKK